MHMSNGVLFLSGVRGASVYESSIGYTDSQNNKINIPMATLIRLYELAKFDVERRGRNWEEYADKIIQKEINDNVEKIRV